MHPSFQGLFLTLMFDLCWFSLQEYTVITGVPESGVVQGALWRPFEVLEIDGFFAMYTVRENTRNSDLFFPNHEI